MCVVLFGAAYYHEIVSRLKLRVLFAIFSACVITVGRSYNGVSLTSGVRPISGEQTTGSILLSSGVHPTNDVQHSNSV